MFRLVKDKVKDILNFYVQILVHINVYVQI